MPRSKKTAAPRRRLVLLDAHAIIHRAYHALPEFSSSKGEATGALYGVATMLIKVIADFKPHAIAACFDLPKPTYRHQAYEGYKAGRAKADEPLVEQLKKAPELFEAFSVPCLSAEGFEADDLLGTLAASYASDPSVEVVIASGDMDTLQLVSGEAVKVFTLKKGLSDTVLYDEDAVRNRFGFGPLQIPDYKGLAGDPSDNIVGVKGVGEKTATALISAFGTVEAMYEFLAAHGPEELAKKAGVTPRVAKLVAEHEEEARFSKMLATIRRDAPVSLPLPERPYTETVDFAAVDAICARFEFRTLAARLRAALGAAPAPAAEPASPAKAPPPSAAVAEIGLALWVADSNATNPSLADIYTFAKTDDFDKARAAVFAALAASGGERVYRDIELPLVPIIADMERRGIQIDRPYLASLKERYGAELAAAERTVYEHAGQAFNINSPKQLAEILYDKLNLAVGKRIKKTEGGARSTRESELAKLADVHPIIPTILSFRELSKLMGTYIEPLPALADADGRIHTHFIQSGTTTGRMASESPNLQNIPVRSEHGKNIRRAFIAPSGKRLLSLDYSQMELRLAAILSGDEKFADIFARGEDVHAAVAARVFGKDIAAVSADERRAAKSINFGILYGMGATALKESLSQGGQTVTLADAQKFLEDYFKTFDGLAAFLDETKAKAARYGYTETMFGRRRTFEGLSSRIPYIRAAAERMAINAPIQGSGADIVKLAMVKSVAALEAAGLAARAALILQVHDELVYEVDADAVGETAALIKETMEAVVPVEQTKGVRLVVEGSAGENWEDMEELPL